MDSVLGFLLGTVSQAESSQRGCGPPYSSHGAGTEKARGVLTALAWLPQSVLVINCETGST